MARRPIQGSISASGAASPRDLVSDQLRTVMQHWPTGVAVMAVKAGERIESITVNSLVSVSLKPPLVLISLATNAAIRPVLDDVARFTLSFLAVDQSRTASMVADRMPMIERLFDDAADPAIKEAIATMVCTVAQTHTAGDHILYLGAVEAVRLGRDAAPLMFLGGTYHR